VVEPVRRFCRARRPPTSSGAWFERDTPRTAVVHKEDADRQWLTPDRQISPSLDATALEHHVVAAYDNLCRVDVLPDHRATAGRGRSSASTRTGRQAPGGARSLRSAPCAASSSGPFPIPVGARIASRSKPRRPTSRACRSGSARSLG
jgi:hypothetical protein